VYLFPQTDYQSQHGTHFFRHSQTGLDHFDDADEASYELLKMDARDLSKWECIEVIEPRYNRLAIFDSRRFHAEPAGFGKTPEEGRLIQIFNFRSSSHDINKR